MSSATLHGLSEYDPDEVPEGWYRSPGLERILDVTAAFEHESNDWAVTVQRHGPGSKNGSPVCEPILEDGLVYVAPIFETQLVCLYDEGKPRPIGDEFQSHVFADPDGRYLLGNLRQMDADRETLEERPSLDEWMAEFQEGIDE